RLFLTIIFNHLLLLVILGSRWHLVLFVHTRREPHTPCAYKVNERPQKAFDEKKYIEFDVVEFSHNYRVEILGGCSPTATSMTLNAFFVSHCISSQYELIALTVLLSA